MKQKVDKNKTKQNKKTEKERGTEGQKRNKIERTRKREGNGEQGGRVSLASITFLRLSRLHGMPAIPANHRAIKILEDT